MNFQISKRLFYFVLILILLFPLIIKSKLLLFGATTEGEVIYLKRTMSFRSSYLYPIIQFETEESVITMYGTQNSTPEIGQKVRIIYEKGNPINCMIFSFSYIYLNSSSVIPGILLLIWLAMYSTYRKRKIPNDSETQSE